MPKDYLAGQWLNQEQKSGFLTPTGGCTSWMASALQRSQYFALLQLRHSSRKLQARHSTLQNPCEADKDRILCILKTWKKQPLFRMIVFSPSSHLEWLKPNPSKSAKKLSVCSANQRFKKNIKRSYFHIWFREQLNSLQEG